MGVGFDMVARPPATQPFCTECSLTHAAPCAFSAAVALVGHAQALVLAIRARAGALSARRTIGEQTSLALDSLTFHSDYSFRGVGEGHARGMSPIVVNLENMTVIAHGGNAKFVGMAVEQLFLTYYGHM